MSEHVSEWLSSLLDSELHGPRLRQVTDHLAGCATCRAEFTELSRLSVVLKQASPAEADRSADRFIAELTLRLPRRAGRAPSAGGAASMAWWLAPAGAVAVWALLQAGLTVNGLLSAAGAGGLLDGAAGWWSGGPQHTQWFLAALGLFGGQLGGNGLNLLDVLDSLGVLSSDLTARLAWQAGFGLLYWAGLAFWLTHALRGTGQTFALPDPGQDDLPA